MKNIIDYNDQHHFKLFAKSLEQAIAKYSEQNTKLSLLEKQRKQIRTLIALESKFRRTLVEHNKGAFVYKAFIDYITNQKRNILAARPFFRERQTTFTKYISGALKNNRHKSLFKYKINYSFILFALKAFSWPVNSKIRQLANKIEALRKQITEENLPLAISQARIFYASTPKSHLSWLDLVQIHAGGLLIAVDKFVPPKTSEMTDAESLQAYRKFRAVAIGRMMSDRLEQYSETVLHFYPIDKKKIYRANKVIRYFGDDIDYEKLAEHVNLGIEQESQKTNAREIRELLASAGCLSGDTVAAEGAGGNNVDEDALETTIDRHISVEEDVSDKIESGQAVVVMKKYISKLSKFQQKILKMKGISC